MNVRRALVALVAAALVLPIATVILIAAGRLLAAMQDTAGAVVLDRLALAAGLLWAMDLIGLVIVQAIDALGPPARRPHDPPE